MGQERIVSDKEFAEICKRFNEYKVEYITCGAFASKLHGIERVSRQVRFTTDMDFIVKRSKENVKRIKRALRDIIPEIEELKLQDLKQYRTTKIVSSKYDIDLTSNLWGVDYEKASKEKVIKEINGVKIPVMSIDHLLEMKKDSFRTRDIADTFWLTKIKERQKEPNRKSTEDDYDMER